MTKFLDSRIYKNTAFAFVVLTLSFACNAQSSQSSANPAGAPAPRKEVKVAEKILQQYVGDYELQPGFVLSVTLEGTQLFTQATGQVKVEVFAESETKFFLKVVEAQIEFVRDDSGKVTKLILYQGGQRMEAKKLIR
jgi:hypothetical protein